MNPQKSLYITQYGEQISNTLNSSCTLLHVQAYNLSWRNAKGASGKTNMFNSLKYLSFLRTPPKARKLTETKMNNKKNPYQKGNNQIAFPQS